MNEPLISVIVPIYKVEQYLNKCINSIVNQTYSNLEIILVDDGSPDSCPQMCDEWAKKDSRIIVVHKKNGGLSDARNAGLDVASGEYISFIDSDDYISIYMYSNLMNLMSENNADIVQCELTKFSDKQEVNELLDYSNQKIQIFNTEQALESLILESPLKQVVWNKLYKREVLRDILFEKGKLNEDDYFTYQVFNNASKIVYTNISYYNYLIRSTSIMGNTFNLKRLDGVEARYLRYRFMKQNYTKLSSIDKKSFLFFVLYSYQRVLTIKDKEERDKGKTILNEYYKEVSGDNVCINLNVKEKVWIFLINNSLDLTARLRNWLGIGK